MHSNVDFMQNIQKLQAQYYEKNTKNTFFKKAQKQDCAETVIQNIDLNELISRTVYVIPNTNKVFIDYLVFKTYAVPSIYPQIVDKVLNTFQDAINVYGNYEVHINLSSFSVSACERYKSILEILCTECFKLNAGMTILLTKLITYYTPSAMETIIKILTPFIDPVVRPKLVLINKKESEALMNALMV